MSDHATIDLDADSVDTMAEKLQAVTAKLAGPPPLGSIRVGAEKLIPALVRTSLTSTRGRAEAGAHWVFQGVLWRRFTTSAAVLKQLMVIEPGRTSRSPFVIRLGEHFIGLVMPAVAEAETEDQREIRDEWIDRLPESAEEAAA